MESLTQSPNHSSFSSSISVWGKAKTKTNEDRKIRNKMHEHDTKWAGQSCTERKEIPAWGGQQQESICAPLSSKNHTFGTWHSWDGSVWSCHKPSSLLRNLAFSLWQEERALSASWKRLLTAAKAACGGKAHRKMQSYQTECHTWHVEHTQDEFTNTHECTKHSVLLPRGWKNQPFPLSLCCQPTWAIQEKMEKKKKSKAAWASSDYTATSIFRFLLRDIVCWNHSACWSFPNIQSLYCRKILRQTSNYCPVLLFWWRILLRQP